MRVTVAFNRRDEANWWCEYNGLPGVWGRAVMDNSIYGMSLIFDFPPEAAELATVFALKFA
jgi:hypothetical protein